MKILVTGGAGFIGSALVRYLIRETEHSVVNLDKLTYAGSLEALEEVVENARYSFERVDICDAVAVADVFQRHQPDAVMHLAAESHVDRSLAGAEDFIQTNVVGTYRMLDVALGYFQALESERKEWFRFLHVSTDEVYGDLGASAGKFVETTRYAPSSPYSASKASSDHLVRAWSRSYGLPVLLTHCSNNYGPYQFPEKLIPTMLLRALSGQRLPVFGSGLQVRDWLYVEDHVRALMTVLERGTIGESYNIGGNEEHSNIDLVRTLCRILEMKGIAPPRGLGALEELIEHVADRPGHDVRYAVDATKIRESLGWQPKEDFSSGLERTVDWYLAHIDWARAVASGEVL